MKLDGLWKHTEYSRLSYLSAIPASTRFIVAIAALALSFAVPVSAGEIGDCAAEYTSGQGGLNCTANDDGGEVVASGYPTFCVIGTSLVVDVVQTTFLNSTNAERYDPRYWIALEGGDIRETAANGGPAICSTTALSIGSGGGVIVDLENNIGDTCGDIDSGVLFPLTVIDTITLDCVPDANGAVLFNTAITWETKTGLDCVIGALRGPPDPSISKSQASCVETTLQTESMGRVTVIKSAPEDVSNTNFTFNWSTTSPPSDPTNAAMNPSDPFTLQHAQSQEIYSLITDTTGAVVTITEQDPTGLGFTLESFDCPGASVSPIPNGVEVTLSYDENNPGLADVTCTFNNAQVQANPAMSVSKSSTTGAITGPGTVTYEYVVTNLGNVDLTGVSLSDDNDNDNMVCPSTTVTVGSTMDCSATHTVTQAEIDANGSPTPGSGSLSNVVTASSNETADETDNLDIPINQTPGIAIDKVGTFNDESQDGFAQPGETISYTFQVSNTGNVTLTNVAVTDPLVSPITCPSGNPIPSLDPGASETCNGSYTVVQADIDAGQRDNIGTADSDQTGPETDPESVPLGQNPGMTVDKTSTTSQVSSTGAVPYSYLVTNSGNVTLTGISLVDDNTDGAVSCPGTTLAPGDSFTCTAQHTVTQGELDANGSPVADSGNLVNNVTGSSNEAPDATDDLTIPLQVGAFATILKTGSFNDEGMDGLAQPGETISYTFEVTNTGDSTLNNVAVTDPLVSPITCPSGNPIPSLDPGGSETCTGSYTLDQDDVDNGQVDNTATVDSDETEPETDDETVTLPTLAQVTIDKNGTWNDDVSNGVAEVGETISYTFDVTNSGSVTLTGVAVTDPIVSPITCPSGNPIPSMAPGASEQCTGSYTLVQGDIDAGERVNTATALGSSPDGTDDVTDDDTDTVDLPIDTEIAIIKTGTFNDESQDGLAQVGETISYSFQITNSGNIALTNVTVTDPLVSPITCPSGNPIPSLASGASETCTGSYTVTQADIDAGQRDNTATADSDQTEPETDDETVNLPTQPGLSVLKTGTFNDESQDNVAQVGETISYTFEVSNLGNVTLNNVSVTDPLVSPISCPGGNPIPSLAVGASETCTGSYTVTQADVDAGQRDNTATADSDETTPVTDDETVILPTGAALAIDKVGTFNDESQDGDAQVGETISYSFQVSNTGNVTLTNISVTDPLVPVITCPSGNPIPSLAAAASETCTGSYILIQTDVDNGQVVNTATADSDETGPETDDETVILQPGVSMTVVKSSPTASISAPTTVSYAYLVTNTGTATLTAISLVDDNISSAMSCPATTLAAGTSFTCTATKDIMQTDVDNNGSPVVDSSELLNNVTASSAEAPDDTDSLSIPFVIDPSIAMIKSSTTSGVSTEGTVPYSYMVTNSGNVTLTGIRIDDDNDEDDASCPMTTLAPGESTTCTATHNVTAGEIDANGSPVADSGVLVNNATAYGSSPRNTDDVSDDDSLSIPFGEGAARFTVIKDFSDDNTATVDVTISCNTGLPLTQEFTVSEGNQVTFVVESYEAGAMDCVITEEVPEGYTPNYFDGDVNSSVSCVYEEIPAGANYLCFIYNEIDPVTVVVNKEWNGVTEEDAVSLFATATWECRNVLEEPDSDELGTVSGGLSFEGEMDSEAISGLYPDFGGSSYCTVTEMLLDSAAEGDDSDCANVPIGIAQGNSCTIYNTVFFEGIPALNRYGMLLLALLMLGVGVIGFRRFS